MIASALGWIVALIGVAVVIGSLQPDYRLRDPPKRMTNVLFRPDLLTVTGRRWRVITIAAWISAFLLGLIGWLVGNV